MCIFLYLYFEIKNLPRYPHLSSLQHEIEPPFFLLFFFIGRCLPKNGILCIEIFFLGSATFCNMLRHISYARIFKGTFFTIEKDTTKSLRLRGIRVLDATSRREETKANGATKWRQISKTCKKSFKKSLLVGIKIFFREMSLLYV